VIARPDPIPPPGKSKNRDSEPTLAGQVFIAVSDLGIGIIASMKDRSAQAVRRSVANMNDWDVLEQASLAGISRTGLRARGLGLHYVSMQADITHIRSGNGTLSINRNKALREARRDAFVPGTSIVAILDISDQRLRDEETRIIIHASR
jgi:hypothetical protein